MSKKIFKMKNNMKNLKTVTYMALILLISSCANMAKFPVSRVTLAADIVAYKKHDKNGNCMLSITAKNLAAVDRIKPSKSTYVVWIVTEKDGVRNIGKLSNRNAKRTGLETLTPYNFTEVFITAEDQADVTYPTGIEISRAKFKY